MSSAHVEMNFSLLAADKTLSASENDFWNVQIESFYTEDFF